jgi:hypothetical protein
LKESGSVMRCSAGSWRTSRLGGSIVPFGADRRIMVTKTASASNTHLSGEYGHCTARSASFTVPVSVLAPVPVPAAVAVALQRVASASGSTASIRTTRSIGRSAGTPGGAGARGGANSMVNLRDSLCHTMTTRSSPLVVVDTGAPSAAVAVSGVERASMAEPSWRR